MVKASCRLGKNYWVQLWKKKIMSMFNFLKEYAYTANCCHSSTGDHHRSAEDSVCRMILCYRGCPMHCRMFYSNSGPSALCPSCDNQCFPLATVPWEAKLSLVEDHCSEEWRWRRDLTSHLSSSEPFIFIFCLLVWFFHEHILLCKKKKKLIFVLFCWNKGRSFQIHLIAHIEPGRKHELYN